jgi:hypothetical protein
VAGLCRTEGGDHRFVNNVFIGTGSATIAETDPQWNGGHGLWVYDFRTHANQATGNVYYQGSEPARSERGSALRLPAAPLSRGGLGGRTSTVAFRFGPEISDARSAPVTSATLGRSRVTGLPFENADGSPLALNRDFHGRLRRPDAVIAGPFADARSAGMAVRVR